MNNDNPSLPVVNGSLPPSITGMTSTNHLTHNKAQDSLQMSKAPGPDNDAASPARPQAQGVFPDIRLAFDRVVADLMKENSATRTNQARISVMKLSNENPVVHGDTGSIQGTRTSKGLAAQKVLAAESSTAHASDRAIQQARAQSKAMAAAPIATVTATTAALVQMGSSLSQSTAPAVLHKRDTGAALEPRGNLDLHASRSASIAMATSTSTPQLSQSPALIDQSLDLVQAFKMMQTGQKKNTSDVHSSVAGTNDSLQIQARSFAVLLIVLGALILV